MDESQLLEILETALLCADQPMKVSQLAKLFTDEDLVDNDAIKQQLLKLQDEWRDKGLELAELAGGWRFQSRPRMQKYLERLNPEKPPKYSRAVMETLAIIAWRQPVTRGDIEDIRGVSVSSQIIKTLEERDWIEVIGHRDGPGRPALFGITKHFLDDMGLKSIEELPTIDTNPEQFMSGDSELAQLLQEQSTQLSIDAVPTEAEQVQSQLEGSVDASIDAQDESEVSAFDVVPKEPEVVSADASIDTQGESEISAFNEVPNESDSSVGGEFTGDASAAEASTDEESTDEELSSDEQSDSLGLGMDIVDEAANEVSQDSIESQRVELDATLSVDLNEAVDDDKQSPHSM